MLSAFKEKSFPFAHRNVIVYYPPEADQSPSISQQNTGPTDNTANKNMIEAGAAAAMISGVEEDKPKPPVD